MLYVLQIKFRGEGSVQEKLSQVEKRRLSRLYENQFIVKFLLQVKPQYEAMKKREEECTRELALKEQKRKELYAKQGRGSQFTSKDDRDRWIQQELKSLNKQLKDKKEHRDKLEADLKRDATKAVELTKKIEEQSQELERQKNCIDEHNKQCYELKKNKDQYQATRK